PEKRRFSRNRADKEAVGLVACVTSRRHPPDRRLQGRQADIEVVRLATDTKTVVVGKTVLVDGAGLRGWGCAAARPWARRRRIHVDAMHMLRHRRRIR